MLVHWSRESKAIVTRTAAPPWGRRSPRGGPATAVYFIGTVRNAEVGGLPAPQLEFGSAGSEPQQLQLAVFAGPHKEEVVG
jgi:hypothetical protein